MNARVPILLKLLLIVAAAVIWQAAARQRPDAIPGDGLEYMLMTEAFARHGTPDLRIDDVRSFRNRYERYDTTGRYGARFDALAAMPGGAPAADGFFRTSSDALYSYHFWFYSLSAVPFRWLGLSVYGVFAAANTAFMTLTLLWLLFGTRSRERFRLILAALFVVSPAVRYIFWPHPEVLTACLLTLAFERYFNERRTIAVFLTALAAWQNPPVFILGGFMALHAWQASRWQLKTMLKLIGAGLPVVVPALFYYINFGTTNLIVEAGGTDTGLISAQRLYDFFFDTNQGMILAAPLILLAFITLWIKSIIRAIRQRKGGYSELMILGSLLIMAVGASATANWNHGQNFFMRYAVWASVPIMAHTALRLSELRLGRGLSALALLLASQLWLMQLFGLNAPGWLYVYHAYYAKQLLIHAPELYSPDPEIFIERTRHREGHSPDDSPVPFITPDGRVTKILIYGAVPADLPVTCRDSTCLAADPADTSGWHYLTVADCHCTPTEAAVDKTQ